MHRRRDYFLGAIIDAKTSMEAAWKWATEAEKKEIIKRVKSYVDWGLRDHWRVYFQLVSRDPLAREVEEKDKVLRVNYGMAPTFRGQYLETICKLVGVRYKKQEQECIPAHPTSVKLTNRPAIRASSAVPPFNVEEKKPKKRKSVVLLPKKKKRRSISL